MSIDVKKKVLLGLVVAVCTLVCSGATQAYAAPRPWWHVHTLPAPASQPSGQSIVVVEVSNLGDRAVEPTETVTLSDKLPTGVSASAIYGEGGGGGIGREIGEFEQPGRPNQLHCVLVTLTCTYDGTLFPYERFMIDIHVKVDTPGAGLGVNEVSVTGGDASPVTSRRPLGLGDSPPSPGVEDYEITPEEEGGALDTQAGSHPFQLTTTLFMNAQTVPAGEAQKSYGVFFEVKPLSLTKDLHFVLPPGLVGNPTPLPQCSVASFLAQSEGLGECPIDSAVGVATPIVSEPFNDLEVPWGETKSLYNLTPSTGEPAKFGFDTLAGPVILDTKVRADRGYGVEVSTSNVLQNFGLIGSQVTFWGNPSDPRHDISRSAACLGVFESTTFRPFSCPGQEGGQPFLVMPTSCEGQLHTTVETDSWEKPSTPTSFEYTFANLAGEPYKMDSCNQLNFEPSIEVAPDGPQASTPTGLSVDVHVPQDASLNPAGRAESSVRDTTVALPAGVVLNPSSADGLSSCAPAQIGLESAMEQACAESAKVGTVEIHTPLLPHPLVGAAYLAQQEQNPFGSLVALYIVARDPVSGVLVKVAGEVKPDPVTGQLVSTFDNTPQLPFEDLTLHFFGGSRAPLGTPALCGGYTTTAAISPWSGSGAVDSSSEFKITSGPNGSHCVSKPPFAPELTTGSTNIQAGAFTPFTMTMSREDGNQDLDAISLHTPPGFSGLLAGVELCPEPQASQGLCSSNSLIGETTVSVGLGGNPYTVKGGKVYITGPYKGAPFGLSIVNPAKAGPFDLESTKTNHPACDCLVVRAKIEVDPTTAALTVSSDTSGPYSIPTILEGIPLQIKHVNVTINRPGFTFNPTDCEPMKITGTLTSNEGATSTLNEPFQVTNCATLAFKPEFHVTTSAHTSRTQGASLDTKVSYPAGSLGTAANIKSVKVDLPHQLPSRLTTLQKACTDKQFEANPAACPVASHVGTVVVHTPIVPVPLTGPAYFVSHGSAKFPELIVVLQGYGITIDLHGETFISKEGLTSTTFHSVPDEPFESFELNLPQGPYSALSNNGNLCTAGQTITVSKRVKRRVHGHLRTVTVKVKKKGPGLLLPTSLVAQNGMTIHQNTPIGVTGCPKAHRKAKKGRKKK